MSSENFERNFNPKSEHSDQEKRMPFDNLEEGSESFLSKVDIEGMAAETEIELKEICRHLKIPNPATLQKIESTQNLEEAYKVHQEVAHAAWRNDEEIAKATEKWRSFAKQELPTRIQAITNAQEAQQLFELCPTNTPFQANIVNIWAKFASSLDDWEKLYRTLYPIHSREKIGDDLPKEIITKIENKREEMLNGTLNNASNLEEIKQAYETFKRYSLKEWQERAQSKWNEISQQTIPASLESSSDEELSLWSKNLPKESSHRDAITRIINDRLLEKIEKAPDLKTVWELAHNAPLSSFGATMHSIWSDRTQEARDKASTKEDWILIVKYGDKREKDIAKLAAFYKK